MPGKDPLGKRDDSEVDRVRWVGWWRRSCSRRNRSYRIGSRKDRSCRIDIMGRRWRHGEWLGVRIHGLEVRIHRMGWVMQMHGGVVLIVMLDWMVG